MFNMADCEMIFICLVLQNVFRLAKINIALSNAREARKWIELAASFETLPTEHITLLQGLSSVVDALPVDEHV